MYCSGGARYSRVIEEMNYVNINSFWGCLWKLAFVFMCSTICEAKKLHLRYWYFSSNLNINWATGMPCPEIRIIFSVRKQNEEKESWLYMVAWRTGGFLQNQVVPFKTDTNAGWFRPVSYYVVPPDPGTLRDGVAALCDDRAENFILPLKYLPPGTGLENIKTWLYQASVHVFEGT